MADASRSAEIIMLRAIALKPVDMKRAHLSIKAEIIMLRAIALKPEILWTLKSSVRAEIIMLRAIALKPLKVNALPFRAYSRDHNATSYSTETRPQEHDHLQKQRQRS